MAATGAGMAAAPAATPVPTPTAAMVEGATPGVPTLVSLCTKTISYNASLLINAPYLPEDVCDMFLRRLQEQNAITDESLSALRRYQPPDQRHERCRLRTMDLADSPDLTCAGVEKIAYHPLVCLKLDRCPSISGDLFKVLRCGCCRTLQALFLSHCKGITPDDFKELVWFKQLRSVNLSHTKVLANGLSVLTEEIVELDLSFTNIGVEALAALRHLVQLKSLSLAGTGMTHKALNFFLQMKRLERLDVSECRQLVIPENHAAEDAEATVFDNTLQEFFSALSRLQCLKWLNLSSCSVTTDTVRGLLASCKLSFLGIVNTRASAMATAEAPPSIVVASLNTKAEILNALAEFNKTGSYDLVLATLRAVFRLVSPTYTPNDFARITQDRGLSKMVIDCMYRFMDQLDLQVVSSAILFYTTLDTTTHQSQADRREALRAIMHTMESHIDCLQLVKNCCLTLRNFQTENELALFSRKVAILLLNAARRYEDRTIQLTSVFLCCHNLASLHPWHKAAIGAAGGIKLAVQLINEKKGNVHDADTAVLEACWTFLWNITDETPSNAEQFLAEGGLGLIVEVLQLYPDAAILRRNIMGLVTNIAEVRTLRESLMTDEMLSELDKCLTSLDDLEVSYNVTGTLCHLMAEGEEFWERHDLGLTRRNHLLHQITTAVDSWDLSAERWINYRCLRPVISLLSVSLPWELRYWASWALASLCMANPEKYCPMCIEEDALSPIQSLLKHAETMEHRTMAEVLNITMARCREWQSRQQQSTEV